MHAADGPFPKFEWVADLVGDAEYIPEGIRWRLFEDPSGEMGSGKHVLITLGKGWTILDGKDFLKVARRILEQMDD